MSLIKHAQRIAAKAKAVADDRDAIYPADDADTTFVQESLRGHRPARDVLPTAALLEALGPAGLRRLQSPAGLGLIVHVPGPDWVPHIETALRGITGFAQIFARNGSSRTGHRASEGNDQACSLLSQGARVAGVSQSPDRFLPAALVAGADLVVRIGQPSNRIVAHVIREVTGKRARRIPPLVAATLGFDALTGSIRLGTSPAACIARIQAAASALSGVDPLLGDIPALDELHGYGPALDWAKRLVADLDAWRAGQLKWQDISRCCLLSSEPGLGKSTLVRAIAKAAKLPLISTGVSQWMTPSGYLNDVIRSAEDAFARAAAQSPAILFIDETDSIPSGFSMDSRGKDYWTPLVNSVLTNIDSNNSGANSRLIIIGATNHADALDPALIRPGRLHPTIRIGRPSPEDLVGIMRQHLGGDLVGVDLEGVALLGAGSTGADVTAWVRQARATARAEGRRVTLPDLAAAVAPPDDRSAEEIRACATHEVAHCLAAVHYQVSTVTSVTVAMSRSTAGRALTRFLPRTFLTRDQIERIAIVALAGRAMDALVGAPHTGAGGDRQSDLGRATEAIVSLHTAYGLGDSLVFVGGPAEGALALRSDAKLRRAVEADLARLMAEATSFCRAHRAEIEAVADRLVERRALSGDDIAVIVQEHRMAKGHGRGGRHAG